MTYSSYSDFGLGYCQLADTFERMKKCCEHFQLFKRAALYQQEIAVAQSLEQKIAIMNSKVPQPLIYYDLNSMRSYMLPKDLDLVVKSAVNQTFLSELSSLIAICTCIDAALWGRIIIDLDDWQEPGVLQSLIVADSGKRKSSLFNWLLKIFISYQDQLGSNCDPKRTMFNKKLQANMETALIKKAIQNGALYDKRAIENLWQENEDFKSLCNVTPNEEFLPRIFCSSSSHFGLMQDMAKNGGCLFFCSAEPTGCEEIINKKNLELFLKGYTQEPFSRTSGRGSVHIPHSSLNVLVASQYPFLKKILASNELMEQGFLARFLITINSNAFENNFNVDEAQGIEAYREKISELLETFYTRDLQAKKFKVRVTEEAKKLLINFREVIAGAIIDKNVKMWAAKLHGQAARIALALHAWNYGKNLAENPITLEEMTIAIEIATMIAHQANFIFDPDGFLAMTNAKKIYDSLLRLPSEQERSNFIRYGTTSTQLQQRIGLKKHKMIPALKYLEKNACLALWDNGSGNLIVMPHWNFFGTFNVIL